MQVFKALLYVFFLESNKFFVGYNKLNEYNVSYWTGLYSDSILIFNKHLNKFVETLLYLLNKNDVL